VDDVSLVAGARVIVDMDVPIGKPVIGEVVEGTARAL